MELNTNGHHTTYEMKISGFDLDYKANKVYGVVLTTADGSESVSYTHLDVYKRQSLLTFVPFTFVVLSRLGADVRRSLLVPVVCMQTIAANLGSMLTPIGNPQNLYLYGKSGMSIGGFVLLMLPYTLVSLLLLLAWAALVLSLIHISSPME